MTSEFYTEVDKAKLTLMKYIGSQIITNEEGGIIMVDNLKVVDIIAAMLDFKYSMSYNT